MTLKEYIEKHGLKVSFISNSLGITRQTIYRINRGEPVSKELADKIFTWTNGVVTIPAIEGLKSHVRNRMKKRPELVVSF